MMETNQRYIVADSRYHEDPDNAEYYFATNDLAELDPSLKEVGRELNILPIFTESGGWYGLNLNDEIVSAGWDAPYEVRIEHDRRIQNLVLFQGIQNYPELSSLMPIRNATDETCPHCKGTGIYPLSHMNIGCYCGGLGWIPGK